MNTAATKTPFAWPDEMHPSRVGAYECVTAIGRRAHIDMETASKHYRWWNGQQWSFPLDYDPELDSGAIEPFSGQYPSPLHYDMCAFHESFQWRGFTEDQDEL